MDFSETVGIKLYNLDHRFPGPVCSVAPLRFVTATAADCSICIWSRLNLCGTYGLLLWKTATQPPIPNRSGNMYNVVGNGWVKRWYDMSACCTERVNQQGFLVLPHPDHNGLSTMAPHNRIQLHAIVFMRQDVRPSGLKHLHYLKCRAMTTGVWNDRLYIQAAGL